MLAALGAWPVLLVALLVWGLAPGLVNRLIALGFPKDDERRCQMIGDLYDVPRWEQPFWVLQQAERLLTEGLPARVRARRERARSWRFDSGVRWHRRYPTTFMIPPAGTRRDLQIGDWAKLLFVPARTKAAEVLPERIWVEVTSRTKRGYVGHLLSAPVNSSNLVTGDVVAFGPDQILDTVFPQGLGVTVEDIAPDGDDLRENGNH